MASANYFLKMSLHKELHMDWQVFNITERGTRITNSTTSDLQSVTFTSFCVLLYVFLKDTHSALSPHIKQWRFLQSLLIMCLSLGLKDQFQALPPGHMPWQSLSDNDKPHTLENLILKIQRDSAFYSDQIIFSLEQYRIQDLTKNKLGGIQAFHKLLTGDAGPQMRTLMKQNTTINLKILNCTIFISLYLLHQGNIKVVFSK